MSSSSEGPSEATTAASETSDETTLAPAPVDLCVVLVNAPESVASRIGRLLVEARLAACVNVIPVVKSIYRWQGKIEEENEATLLIKTRVALVPALTDAVKAAHPYAVPEVLVVPTLPGIGNLEYLAWVASET